MTTIERPRKYLLICDCRQAIGAGGQVHTAFPLRPPTAEQLRAAKCPACADDGWVPRSFAPRAT